MKKPPLTVRDLISEQEFQLRLLAGSAAIDRAVEGIHLSELEDPTPWMAPNSILLTTGLNIKADPTAGVRLVELLSATGMAGLGVALEHYLTELPAAAVQRAEELAFPVFTLPKTVPFRRLLAYSYDALAARDTYRLRRSMSVQNHLLELLIEERGIPELVQQLGHLLEATVMLFDGAGSLLTVAEGQARVSARGQATLWSRYLEHRDRKEPHPAFQSSGFRVSYREASLHGAVERVLLAVYTNRPIPELAETTLSFAQKLLMLDVLRGRDVAALQRRMRTGLMDDLVSGIGTETELASRMRQYSLDASRSWRLAVLDIDEFAERFGKTRRGAHREERIQEFKSRFLEATDAFLANQGLPFLSILKSDTVVTLIQFADPTPPGAERTLAALRARLEETLSPARISIGVSAAGVGAAPVALAFRQAREALGLTRQTGGLRIRFFDQIHPQNRLLDAQSPEGLAAIYDETVRPLADHDAARRSKLLHTLEVFLAHERSLSRTATELHMHRNTLAKRIARIEGILGRSLAATDDLVAVGLGLRARDLLEGRSSSR
ncbi:MAG TPA: PucR family transcriptional regulator ligand-binding domain-containing protein [Thermoleophilia bacterium]|nr:PucR family transcriptional regulator ligand-binding domain-containing protein [Thermoleophilia bacterium]